MYEQIKINLLIFKHNQLSDFFFIAQIKGSIKHHRTVSTMHKNEENQVSSY